MKKGPASALDLLCNLRLGWKGCPPLEATAPTCLPATEWLHEIILGIPLLTLSSPPLLSLTSKLMWRERNGLRFPLQVAGLHLWDALCHMCT